jgi:hypothetical protein
MYQEDEVLSERTRKRKARRRAHLKVVCLQNGKKVRRRTKKLQRNGLPLARKLLEPQS